MLHLPDFQQGSPGLPDARPQLHLANLAVLAVDHDAPSQFLSLNTPKDQSEHFEESFLLPADLLPLVEQHRDVEEVALLRRNGLLQESVESDCKSLAFDGSIQEQRHTPLQ